MSRADRMPSHAQPAAAAGDLLRLQEENADLKARLADAEQTLNALRNGEIDAIVVGDDIYTLEGAEAASNRFRSDVLAQMQDAVVALDADDHITHVNPAAEQQYGRSASQALGLPREQLYRLEWLEGDDEEQARHCMGTVGYWRGRQRHITADGERLLVEVTWSRLNDPRSGFVGSLQVIRDVSKRAAAEAALRESRARLDFALESARIGEWELDLATGAARRSQQHDLAFGHAEPLHEWSYAVFLSHVHPEDRAWIAELFERTIEQRSRMHFDCRVIWPDGSLHWIEVHGSVFDDGSAPGRMIGTVADISERKRIEAVLRDADHRKDEFLATLAHELRNPLAPIRNSLHIMRLTRAGDVHDKAQAVIERQLEQLVHLVDDLLDVSRISQGKIELRRQLTDVAALIESAVETSRPLVDARRHALTIQLPVSPLVVNVDMTRLTQVISNLLNNAAKYTPEGGRIMLEASRVDRSAVISITDTGIGIPGDMLPRVFDMFTQINRTLERSQGGLGIGLALVKRLVEMHGGSVSSYSAGENAGTTITVRLPAEDTAAADGATAPPEAESSNEPANNDPVPVLVVDDNEDIADSLSELLRLVGYGAIVARNGRQALQLAQSERPHVVLLDIGLPDISGHEVARRLRREPWAREMVLIALTGWGQDDDRRRSMEAGFDEHLVKPVDLSRLMQLMQRVDSARGDQHPASAGRR